jgi:hypothetical protein
MSKPAPVFGQLVPYGDPTWYQGSTWGDTCCCGRVRVYVCTVSHVFTLVTPAPDTGWHSPYYNESHVRLRAYVRSWVDKHITPNCHEWDEAKSIPKEVFVEFAKSGLANTVCGPVGLKAEDITYPLPCGLTATTFDVFHELIIVDEFSRPGSGGTVVGLMSNPLALAECPVR